MEKICKNCKNWGSYYPSACDKIKQINSKAELKIWADDDQGLDAELITQPDFGCNQFEERQGK
jgi:hypothetical protein